MDRLQLTIKLYKELLVGPLGLVLLPIQALGDNALCNSFCRCNDDRNAKGVCHQQSLDSRWYGWSCRYLFEKVKRTGNWKLSVEVILSFCVCRDEHEREIEMIRIGNRFGVHIVGLLISVMYRRYFTYDSMLIHTSQPLLPSKPTDLLHSTPIRTFR